MASERSPGVFERAGIGPGSIVLLDQAGEPLVVVDTSKLSSSCARLTALTRRLSGDDTRPSLPSAMSPHHAGKGLRLSLIPGVPLEYRHPKGFYEASKVSKPISYPDWVKMVTASLIERHPGDAPILMHEQYGVLWKFDVIRQYASLSFPGYCIRCGSVRVGSLVNTDHAHCLTCLPVRTTLKRFCRCCAAPFEARGNIIFGPCHQWLRALRRGF